MRGTMFAVAILTCFLTLAVSGCVSGSKPPVSVVAADSGQIDTVEPLRHPPLGGSAWRLVQIMYMNDTVDLPRDRSKYTLRFEAHGKASIISDCNRATGSWSAESSGQLRFGQLAATQALCPPGSLHDAYLAQFKWVRSYLVKEGNLYLATMADGSIIEFEPLSDK